MADVTSLRPADIRLTGRGFVFGAGMTQFEVRWMTLIQLAAVDPWPEFEVEVKDFGSTLRRRFRPRFAHDAEPLAVEIEKLLAHTARYLPTRVVPGWTAYPDIEWESVPSFPDEIEQSLGEGAYRSTTRTVDIIARRAAPTTTEALLQWLASSPTRPWRSHPLEIRLTTEHLYARRRCGGIYRIPLDSIRGASTSTSEPFDSVYRIGRRLMLILPYREGCQVTAELDRRR